MKPCHINNGKDLVLGITTHLGPYLPNPVPLPQMSLEGTIQYWPPGYATNKNSLTRTVKHENEPIVLDGHDIGMLMPHVTFPTVVNPWYAVIYPMSSCAIQFSASTVIMEDTATGCASIEAVCPMMTCGEPVSTPSAFPVSNYLADSVKVGMTPGDIGMGWISAAASIVLDRIIEHLLPDSDGLTGNDYLDAYLGEIIPDKKALAKKAAAFLSGYAINGSGEIGIGLPFWGADVEVKRDGNLGNLIDGNTDKAFNFSPSEADINVNMGPWQKTKSSSGELTEQSFGSEPKKLF